MRKQFRQDEKGQDAAEYSLLLVLIAVLAVLVLTAMDTSVGTLFGSSPQTQSATLPRAQ